MVDDGSSKLEEIAGRAADEGSPQKDGTMNIYVGNLARDVTDDDLLQAFSAHGQLSSAHAIKDRYSGESRGFGFMEMASRTEALAAISGLNGKELKGRSLNVNEARPRTEGGRPRYNGVEVAAGAAGKLRGLSVGFATDLERRGRQHKEDGAGKTSLAQGSVKNCV